MHSYLDKKYYYEGYFYDKTATCFIIDHTLFRCLRKYKNRIDE